MDKNQLHTLFAAPFDYARFVPFCLDVLGVPRGGLATRPENAKPIVYETDEVLDARQVAVVERGGWRVGVLVYKLAKGSSIQRTIGLRKLVEPLVKYNYDAAIAVFHFPTTDGTEWRLSFIENLPNNKEGRRAARRYTYVFGHRDEFYRTPIANFLELQARPDARKDFLAYRETFSVETLGKRFFNEYKRIYEDFVQEITGRRYLPVKGKSNQFEEKEVGTVSPLFDSVFDNDGKAVRDYVKKMMGRLVFLQFLQKKGWMGVPEGAAWGNHRGERRYLQKLFADYCRRVSDTHFNFLEDVLEPLFFNALNADRRAAGDIAEPALWLEAGKPIRIPFLSGSLFERDALDGKVCRFAKAHFRDLFDLFDQFNFTIDESDPTDAEIGIAPDMLGQIFENLLEDNKDKGAFYTPHEVVRYMCQEALLAYLDVETGLDRSLLEALVREHFFADDRPAIRVALKDALNRVKICDPAIGSGAFPMGMLHELLGCHKALAREASKTADQRTGAFTEIKRAIIANNIYGVDIEQGAVDIARLRFWLSLVIDEKEPTPLPNLDYKIVRGDSLCAMYDGEPVNLNKGPGVKAAIRKSLARFQELARTFGDTTGEARLSARRQANLALLDAIEAYYTVSLAIETRAEQATFAFAMPQEPVVLSEVRSADEPSAHMLAKVRALRKRIEAGSTEPVPFFDWQVNCSEVLGEPQPSHSGLPAYERGFDIVIGNPPYIHFESIRAKGVLYGVNSLTYDARGDIYCLFYEKGLSLLRPHGILCYITSNSWMRAGYGERLRAFFATYAQTRTLLDFGGAKIFGAATVSTNILLAERLDSSNTKNLPISSPTQACLAQADRDTLLKDLPGYVHTHAHTLAFPSGGTSWAILSPIEQSIKEKIERYGTPLKDWGVEIKRGVLTGLNEAFILDGKTKDRLIAQDPRSAEIIRPILRGRDIKRYGYTFADKWLIATFPSLNLDIDDYPAVRDYLLTFDKRVLAQTGEKNIDGIKGKNARKKTGNKWFETQDQISYWSLFSQPKIVWMELTTPATFALDEHGYYLNNTCYILTSDTVNLRYILAFLNSSLCVWYFDKICATSGVGTRRWIKQYIEQIRLPSSINWSPRGEVNDLQFFCAAFHLSEDERNLFA